MSGSNHRLSPDQNWQRVRDITLPLAVADNLPERVVTALLKEAKLSFNEIPGCENRELGLDQFAVIPDLSDFSDVPTPELNDSNYLTPAPKAIGKYRPLSVGERVSGLLAGVFGSAAETACQPEITAGNLVAGVVSGFLSRLLNDPQIEISSPRLPPSVSPEEALALGYTV